MQRFSASLAARILEVDRRPLSPSAKLRELLSSLTPEERDTLPGRWIVEQGDRLWWEDNLVDWAQALRGV
jgi:hypothetical protein